MSRRQVSTTRRFVDSGNFPFAGALQSKSRSSPILSIGLFIVGAILLIGYVYSGSGKSRVVSRLQVFCIDDDSLELLEYLSDSLMLSSGEWIWTCLTVSCTTSEGDYTCTLEVQKAIPFLKKAYGDNMHKVLHMGPDTCLVVSKLLKEEGTEAWGVEPYDIEDVEADCKSLVGKGIVRVADIKFPLPYRSKSFSIVIVSDAIDYLSPKYLNKTLPEFARLASDGLVIFAGSPGHQKAEVAELSKFGRPAKMRSSTWWVRFFDQISLQGNEAVTKKFEQAASKSSFLPACQVFHLKPYH
ncbi:probable pectin methylesterase CGR3 isoform X1 [Hibiscus syriacus]|uniref:probable pectin methylesterase CGR3 isoform X1 n=1 Tax=Hibiscus syriacus TaxID=106335 RepID=UPI0019210536|nr:probable pectin methylesterase CGR3 isoform X1 [Hibiscus syriacus]XP_038994843.1 probable pectin methylesterase CGR3 isoform X1 [Hibiscus syriacus]